MTQVYQKQIRKVSPRTFLVCLSVLLLFSLSSCAGTGNSLWGSSENSGGVRLAHTQPGLAEFEEHAMTIDRRDLEQSFRRGGGKTGDARAPIDQIRIIEVFEREAGLQRVPRYRIFHIPPGSPYTVLGLEDNDILVGANGYVIFKPIRFQQFVSLLPWEEKADIEILRDGRPIKLDYTFVGPIPKR